MKVGILKQWTKEEDKTLKIEFYKQRDNFKGRWNPAHAQIKKGLERRGIIRTEKSISRRLNRLGLKFFRVHKGEVILKCIDCKNTFFTFERYTQQYFNTRRCKPCQLKHRHDWNKTNRAETLQYYKDYNKLHTKKRMDKQRLRRNYLKV